MKHVLMINPAISTTNIGDEIISESIKNQLSCVLKDSFVIDISSHLPLSSFYSTAIGNCDYKFVCGSNLLMGRLNRKFKQWHIGYKDADFLSGVITVGVGWWQYNDEPNLYTRKLYQKIFNKTYIHSVRDEYTVQMLKKVGITNVLNTSCATMWDLTPEHCRKIPEVKSDSVVFTLTDYNKDIQADQRLIDILTENYSNVYFWPQGVGDFAYFNTLKHSDNISVITPNLKSYDTFLENEDVDYIGTRLHGGIKALQKKKRTIIISIDNRAEEKEKDFNLVCVARYDFDKMNEMINGRWKTNIRIPLENISRWRSQFENR